MGLNLDRPPMGRIVLEAETIGFALLYSAARCSENEVDKIMKQKTTVEFERSTRKFGVGCFDFRIDRPVPFKLTPEDHLNTLQDALKKLNSLSNLSIEYSTAMAGDIEILEEIPSLRNGYSFPSLPFCQIDFSLFIPRRIQEELAIGEVNTETEIFLVTIRHQFHGPVAFVECKNAGPGCRPSQGVQLVRKYLSKEFAKIDGVKFDTIGPSPFHMDFYVHQSENVDEMEMIRTRQRGYDRFDIHVQDVLSPLDNLSEVFYELAGELDEFYNMQCKRVIQMRSWQALENDWRSLLELVEDRIPFYDLRRKVQIYTKARDLIREAFAFSASHSIAKQYAEDSFNGAYGKGLDSYFRDFVESKKNSAFPVYPTQPLIEWATHLHNSSFKVAEIVTLLLSAMLGGVVGGLLTLTFGA